MSESTAVEKSNHEVGNVGNLIAIGFLISDIINHDMFAVYGVLIVEDEFWFNQSEVLKLLLGEITQAEKLEVIRAIRRTKPHMSNEGFADFMIGLSKLCRTHRKSLVQFL